MRRGLRVGLVVLVVLLIATAAPASAAPGDQRWVFDDYSSDDTPTAVATDGDSVFVATGATDAIRAIDAANGTEEWSYSGHTDYTAGVATDGERVYSVANDETARALDPTDGSEIWTFDTTAAVSSVAVNSNGVYIGDSGGTITALDPADGAELWSITPDTDGVDALAAGAGVVYAGSGSTVRQLDASNGDVGWTASMPDNLFEIATDGDVVYVGTRADTIEALSATDGSTKWTYSGHSDLVTSVATNGDRVYSGSTDESVRSIDATEGTLNWQFDGHSGAVYVAVSGTDVYSVGFDGGTVRAIEGAGLVNPTPTEGPSESPVSLSVGVASTSIKTVEFRDAADDSLIGSDSNLSSSASVQWDFDVTARPQQWYAVGLDGSGTVVDQSEPEVFNSLSTAEPVDGATVYDEPVELSVDVAGVESAYGGSATVTFYNGSDGQIGQETLSADGAATATYDNAIAGENEWYAAVEGANGQTDTLANDRLRFQAPSELEIRDETVPGSLLTSANVTIELYVEGQEGQILQRETSNGVIDMSGLPADQPLIAVANAPDYEPRRIYVESILEQQTIYLIPSTADFVEPEFELQDFTGRFPSDETVLQVERPINGEWATIQGDRFGATGAYSVTLVRDQEHRLTLVNLRTGDEKSIGRFTPALDSAETIEVTESEAVVLVEGMPEIVINPSTRTLPALAGQSISGDITAGDAPLEEVSVEIRFDDGTSTDTLATETHNSPESVRFDETLNLSGYSDGQVVVEVGWIAASGESASRTFEFSLREPISAGDTTFGLLPTLATVPDRLAGDADPSTAGSALTFASILLTVIATAVATVRMRLSTETAAAVALFSLSGFWVIGWLSGAIVFVATITGVALAGLRRGI